MFVLMTSFIAWDDAYELEQNTAKIGDLVLETLGMTSSY